MMRAAVVVVGAIAVALAITVKSVGGLFLLCADFIYVMLFPQLTCAVFFERTNTYGALAGYLVGFVLRIIGGEPYLKFDAIVKYPWYDETTGTQLFPFKTMSMLVSFIVIFAVSLPLDYLFKSGKLPKNLDVFQCIVNLPDETREPMTKSETAANGTTNPAFEKELKAQKDAVPGGMKDTNM